MVLSTAIQYTDLHTIGVAVFTHKRAHVIAFIYVCLAPHSKHCHQHQQGPSWRRDDNMQEHQG